MNDSAPARMIALQWESFCLLRQLYDLRAAGLLQTSFIVASYIFDDHNYLLVSGQRHTVVATTALQDLNDYHFSSNADTKRERMQHTLYANRRARYLLHDWEGCDQFFALPALGQLSTLIYEALQPIIVRDVSIEALCVALAEVAGAAGDVQKRRIGTLLGALTPYVQHEPGAVGVALRFAGGFLGRGWV